MSNPEQKREAWDEAAAVIDRELSTCRGHWIPSYNAREAIRVLATECERMSAALRAADSAAQEERTKRCMAVVHQAVRAAEEKGVVVEMVPAKEARELLSQAITSARAYHMELTKIQRPATWPAGVNAYEDHMERLYREFDLLVQRKAQPDAD